MGTFHILCQAAPAAGGTSWAPWLAGGAALLGVLSTSLLAIANARRATSLKRLEIELNTLQTQISDFYGPLSTLFQNHQATWAVLHDLREKLDPADNSDRDLATAKHDAGEYIWENGFSPIHTEIVTILKTKMHLLDAEDRTAAVASIRAYLKHVQMERLQKGISKAGVRSNSVPAAPFPIEIISLIENGLASTKRRLDVIKRTIADVRPSHRGKIRALFQSRSVR